MNKSTRYLLSLWLFLILIPRDVSAWAGRTHMWISRSATAQASRRMPGWEAYADLLARMSIGPDIWKNDDPEEGPRHFIDLEHYGYPSVTLDPDHRGLYDIETGNYTFVEGIVPWVVVDTVNRMSSSMRSNQWDDAVRTAGALAHYAADMCMPLHTTANYDGQESGNDGIHGRWESEMPARKMTSRRFASNEPQYIESLWPALTSAVARAHAQVPAILLADDTAFSEADDSPNNALYYDLLWSNTSDIFLSQVDHSAQLLASLWYTAWINAGSPEIPPPPAELSFDSIYPHPARGTDAFMHLTSAVALTVFILLAVFILIRSYRRKP
ncbi:MAG: zinc dependent phospholipase C family protein [Kiritimatiellae bacterium]|nr:zinc dependent phospholipase C family protein [Kiritimatiellia bacterium]MDD4735714.1 zinc dependent phospholipase C family protein [Kiritimatiellia bacterium]